MKNVTCTSIFFILLFLPLNSCLAHFGVILPSKAVVEKQDEGHIELQLQFMHPYEYEFMDLERPEEFGVVIDGKRHDLTKFLDLRMVNSHKSWHTSFDVHMPGDHIFYMVPAPYWEQAEDTYIQHFTKVVVGAFGLEQGWNRPVGLKAEIVPLTRPYGLWSGNLFCGQVLFDGKPRPGASVEVEFYNSKKELHAPSPVFATQTLITDPNGNFCYAIPRAGWWGFAGLSSIPGAMKRDGRPVDLEIGAVIWVKATEVR